MDAPQKHRALKSLRDYAIYVLLVAAGFMVIVGFVNVQQNKAQQDSLDKQVAATNQLIAELKSLSEQNKKLSQTAANYAYCNALILAKYTQTGDPISIEDLDKCKFTSYPSNTAAQSFNSGQVTQPTQNVQVASNPPTTPAQSSGGNNNQGNQGNGNGNTNNPPPANNGGQEQPKPPLVSLQPASPLPEVTLTTPCIGVQKLLFIGCR